MKTVVCNTEMRGVIEYRVTLKVPDDVEIPPNLTTDMGVYIQFEEKYGYDWEQRNVTTESDVIWAEIDWVEGEDIEEDDDA